MNEEYSTEDEKTSNKFSSVKSQRIFKLCSSILIPFMIGLLTITVSIVQLYIAHAEQEKDYFISEANREKDRLIANRTREQDLSISNRLRWDTILATYIKEISEIMTKSNYSARRRDPLIATVLRVKTLMACRQLDRERKAWLIQFLYESGVISVGQSPIDMTNANLDGVDLSTSVFNSIQQASLRGISLSGASLINASFDKRYLHGANFSGCTMLGASFRGARLENATFLKASLRETDFHHASTKRVNFVWSDLRRSNLTDYQLYRAHSYYLTILPNGTFGRHKNLLRNGNAENIQECSSTNLTAMFDDVWNVIPSNESKNIGFLSINNSIIQTQIDERWTYKLEHSYIDEDKISNADISWNVGRCSFVTTRVPVSIVQYFTIPKEYREDNSTSYSWHSTMFCGTFSNVDIRILAVVEERNSENETLHIYEIDMYPKSTFLFVDRPYDSNATHASFEIRFLIGTKNQTLNMNDGVPVAFCDNIHVSLELTSAVSVISFGF